METEEENYQQEDPEQSEETVGSTDSDQEPEAESQDDAPASGGSVG